jgi:hypothetical protein
VSQQINLYSPILRKQRKVFSALAMLQAMAGLVVGVSALYVYLAVQTPLLEIRKARSAQSLKSELERLKVLGAGESPEARAKALAERRKRLEAELAERSKALQVMQSGVLGRPEGYAEPLRALARLSVDGIWLTRIQFAESGGALSLTGRAVRADLLPGYLERLRGEKALLAEDFVRIEITRPAPAAAPPGGGTPRPLAFVEFVLSSDAAEEKK